MLPDIEKLRISRESRKRGKSVPEKASPFHNPLWAAKLKEQLLLQGRIDPINLGLNFDVKPPGFEVKWPWMNEKWPVDSEGYTWVRLYCTDEKLALNYWMQQVQFLQKKLAEVRRALG